MHEIEKNYEPRTWERVETKQESVNNETLTMNGCNSDSFMARDLMEQGVVPFLVDYELLSAGEDPLCGTTFHTEANTGKILMGVYVRVGSHRTDVETHWYREIR